MPAITPTRPTTPGNRAKIITRDPKQPPASRGAVSCPRYETHSRR
jgi:hypothetical protein